MKRCDKPPEVLTLVNMLSYAAAGLGQEKAHWVQAIVLESSKTTVDRRTKSLLPLTDGAAREYTTELVTVVSFGPRRLAV